MIFSPYKFNKTLLTSFGVLGIIALSSINSFTPISAIGENANWEQVVTNISPTARNQMGMVYDSHNNRFIMYGGTDNSVYFSDTWAFYPLTNSWIDLTSTAGSPKARMQPAMVYDDLNNIILLYGGWNQTGVLNDLWTFNVLTDRWTKITDFASPGGRYSEMTYDPTRDRALFYSGWDGASRPMETWVYDFTNSQFTKLTTINTPTARNLNSLVYDPFNDIYLMYGGYTGSHLDLTASYDPNTNTWSSLNPTVSPSPRKRMHTVYDTSVNKVVLFGGDGAGLNDDVWLYDFPSNEWNELTISAGPNGRYGYSMAFHPTEERIYLFGGSQGSTTNFNDTWILNLHTSNIKTETTTVTDLQTTTITSTHVSTSLETTTVIETSETTNYQTSVVTSSIISTESSALPSFLLGISTFSLVLIVSLRGKRDRN